MIGPKPPWPDILDHAAGRIIDRAPRPPDLPATPSRLDAVTPFLIHRRPADISTISIPLDPTPDVALWWSLAGAPLDPALALPPSAPQATSCALLPRDTYDTVEVWTEGELCALQALWWLAHRHSRPDWRARVIFALRWHLEHTQPDNATNRPWCIAPFVHLSIESDIPEAAFYAETLLHNATAGPARPTRLVAEIIADAADAVRAITRPP